MQKKREPMNYYQVKMKIMDSRKPIYITTSNKKENQMKFKKVDYTEGMNLILNKTGSVQGTTYLGNIDISPNELKKTFGNPDPSDEYKISGEYAFITEDEKALYTIYDWKMTTLYDKNLSHKPKEFWKLKRKESFNIGGNNKGSFFHFKRFIKREIRNNSLKEKS
jgi:hypothetical protein